MTDYRDPNYRDPGYRNTRPDYRDPTTPASSGLSLATWGWIAGFAVVALLLIFAFGLGGTGDRSAIDATRAPTTTTGQGTIAPAPQPPAAKTPGGLPSTTPGTTPTPPPAVKQ